MARPVKILLWLLAALAVVFGVLVVVLATLDWNRLKPAINERVSEALGRPFAIEGELAVDWRRAPPGSGWRALVPWPQVSAEGVTLGNPPGIEADHFVSARRIDFALSPLGLFARRIAIPRIDFTGPSATLARREDGRNNWSFERGPAEGGGADWQLDIGEIGFDAGRIDIDDEVLDVRVALELEPLSEPIEFRDIVGRSPREAAHTDAGPPPYVLAWEAEGRYRGLPLEGEGKVGGFLPLHDPDKPFPLQVRLRVGKTRIALAGTLTDPRKLAALDLELELAGESMAQLYPIAGVTLPDTPPYSTEGRLTARLREPDGASYRYEDFTGKMGQSDLAGSLAYVAGKPRPALSGTLTSKQLRLADLGPLVGVDGAAAESGETPQPPGKVLPVQKFRTERWREMDADVKFAGERIERPDALPINDLDTRLRLEDGVLRLSPLRFGMAGGTLEGELRMDGSKERIEADATLSARGFKLQQMFPDFEPMRTSLGELNAQARLGGQGNSVAALLASADGEASLLINDGVVSRGLMELAGLNLARYVVTELFEDEAVRINCAIADMAVKDGVMSTRLFLVDTENARVYVDGTVSLADEQMDVDIRPRSKGMRLLSLRSPLYVRGSFADPEPGVHAGPLAVRGAGALALGAVAGPLAGLLALIGGSAGEGNPCRTLLSGEPGVPDAPAR